VDSNLPIIPASSSFHRRTLTAPRNDNLADARCRTALENRAQSKCPASFTAPWLDVPPLTAAGAHHTLRRIPRTTAGNLSTQFPNAKRRGIFFSSFAPPTLKNISTARRPNEKQAHYRAGKFYYRYVHRGSNGLFRTLYPLRFRTPPFPNTNEGRVMASRKRLYVNNATISPWNLCPGSVVQKTLFRYPTFGGAILCEGEREWVLQPLNFHHSIAFATGARNSHQSSSDVQHHSWPKLRCRTVGRIRSQLNKIVAEGTLVKVKLTANFPSSPWPTFTFRTIPILQPLSNQHSRAGRLRTV